MSVLHRQELFAVAMELDSALPAGTVLDSSLRKVRDASAYVGIISHKYGTVPDCDANPDELSLTHLEYREAVKLGRPILIFIMGEDHPIKRADVEPDPGKVAKLTAFREEAKLADGKMQRVYRVFKSLDEFVADVFQSVAALRELLQNSPVQLPAVPASLDVIPVPPDLYAQSRYAPSHPFVGRQQQLSELSGWAKTAESRTVLLVDAIGGTGKSTLTWEWINHYAPGVRDWAGKFWYSFYEAGAVMADFCRRALAYMTGQPLDAFADKSQRELSQMLLRQLESRPWLLVLDGLERVLVTYHGHDAAQLLDEQAGAPDEIMGMHPCAVVRPDDEDLLRKFAAAAPSKILISSRLVPTVLLNQASQAIPGVLHQKLHGLRPVDAEELLRGCEVTGDAEKMRAYLQEYCDCHPLVIGFVAGLVRNYFLARGDFDRWVADVEGGWRLDIGELDLKQKRHHILLAALADLTDTSRQLLSTLALLSEAVDYKTLREMSPQISAHDLTTAVTDLEQRGLLQYDWSLKRHDLHPVVRAVAVRDLKEEDLQVVGQRVIDYFSGRADWRYNEVRGLDDVRGHITVVRTQLKMGMTRVAHSSYTSGLDLALYKLEAASEVLALLRPFFSEGWQSASAKADDLEKTQIAGLWHESGTAFMKVGQPDMARYAFEAALATYVDEELWEGCVAAITDAAKLLDVTNRVARSHAAAELALQLADLIGSPRALFLARIQMFESLSRLGKIDEAEALWLEVDLTRQWDEQGLKAGVAELVHAESRFDQAALTADELNDVQAHGELRGNRFVVRGVHRLRGRMYMERKEWAAAITEFETAVSMARYSGIHGQQDEAQLALARLRLGQLRDAPAEIERLSPGHLLLAELRLASGDERRSADHAFAAYREAWADGEPYVRRFDLARAEQLLAELGEDVPALPSYDEAKDRPPPWEERVRGCIADLNRGTER